jgi:hypothetical protein
VPTYLVLDRANRKSQDCRDGGNQPPRYQNKSQGRKTPTSNEDSGAREKKMLDMIRKTLDTRKIKRPLLFLAGGTGLAPFLSMLDRIATTDSAHPVHLVYGVTNDEDLVGIEQLTQLAERIPKRLSKFRPSPRAASTAFPMRRPRWGKRDGRRSGTSICRTRHSSVWGPTRWHGGAHHAASRAMQCNRPHKKWGGINRSSIKVSYPA